MCCALYITDVQEVIWFYACHLIAYHKHPLQGLVITGRIAYRANRRHLIYSDVNFWATVCKTVRPMLSVRWLSCLSCMSACNVHALRPNGWTNQDETWHAGRPRPWPHCIRWGPSPHRIFDPYLLRPNGCMDQDVTWYGARPQLRRLC